MSENKEDSIVKVAWLILFTASYPIIIFFSLLFTSIIWIFSLFSKILNWIIKIFAKSHSEINNNQAIDNKINY